jgi:hypothetical protein
MAPEQVQFVVHCLNNILAFKLMVPAWIDNHTACYIIIPVNKQENKKCLLTKTDFLYGINSV